MKNVKNVKSMKNMKNMKMYVAEIMNSGEFIEGLTAERPCLTHDFVSNVIVCIHMNSAYLGITGKHLEAMIKADGDLVCTICCDSYMDGSSVYADISLKRPEDKEAHHIRRMVIAD